MELRNKSVICQNREESAAITALAIKLGIGGGMDGNEAYQKGINTGNHTFSFAEAFVGGIIHTDVENITMWFPHTKQIVLAKDILTSDPILARADQIRQAAESKLSRLV